MYDNFVCLYQVARELRIVLRDVLSKLSKDIRFTTFRRHVDQSEVHCTHCVVPSLTQLLQREADSAFVKKPMDFETMLQRLDDDAYQTAKQFLEDVAVIRSECVAFCKVLAIVWLHNLHHQHYTVATLGNQLNGCIAIEALSAGSTRS